MTRGGHTHGDPGVECTIEVCKYPHDKFLCGRTSTFSGVVARCVLPARHNSIDSDCPEYGHRDDQGRAWLVSDETIKDMFAGDPQDAPLRALKNPSEAIAELELFLDTMGGCSNFTVAAHLYSAGYRKKEEDRT